MRLIAITLMLHLWATPYLSLSRADEPPRPAASATALQDYISKPDNSYRWRKVRDGQVGDLDYAELILTSQRWQGVRWRHRLFIIRPRQVLHHNQALLVIAGGRWKDKYEDSDYADKSLDKAALFAPLAEQLGTPIAVLLQVPHQPMFGGLVEDEIISHTFDKYLETGDPEWPLLLPMVKSAVRAMDAVQEFCTSEWSISVEKFTVTGGSKRGWTTWLTGASDHRVAAIAPVVIDMLNLPWQLQHQQDTYGEFSEQIHDYTEKKLPQRLQTEAGNQLVQIVDPLAYRQSLTLPKLVILATNDRYWTLDALNLYWDQLLGPKYILYVPNNGHSVKDVGRVAGSIAALCEDVKGGAPLPQLTWSFADDDGGATLSIQSDVPPAKCRIWKSTSATRDFRDSRWVKSELECVEGSYSYHLSIPDAGSAAFFGEVVFDRQSLPLYLSTNVRILSVPDRDESRK